MPASKCDRNPCNWDECSFIEEGLDVSSNVATNLVQMFEAEQTIPFIARYRKAQTDAMGPDELRKALRLWNEAKAIQSRAAAVVKQLEKMDKKEPTLIKSIKLSKSLDEIESLYAPFKPGAKGSLCGRAKALGLESSSMQILHGRDIDTGSLVDEKTKGLDSLAKVEDGIMHILSDYVAKHFDTQKMLKDLICRSHITLESCFTKCADEKMSEQTKYKDYAEFSRPVAVLRPHQVLAINRGEEQKLLSVKVKVPENGRAQFDKFIERSFLNEIHSYHLHLKSRCMQDIYNRIILPQITRNVRCTLKKEAELASVQVFGSNVKQLLLQAPFKRVRICGIDPGFTHGCKTAIISSSGSVLATTVFYLPKKGQSLDLNCMNNVKKLLMEHNCCKIALGNGTGCRQTELLLSTAINKNFFKSLTIKYTIVNECGASIYSVTDMANNELPGMDPNLRSAVSIARRLQDPMAELVKIEPKHLGVGMYQHDVHQKLLCSTLDSVVEECVSFVGVDLNTCSLQLLQRTAGLNANRAGAVLNFRDKVGRIESRDQLLGIKGIGKKSFEQCAGFLRVFPAENSIDGGADLIKQEPIEQQTAGKKRKAVSVSEKCSKKKKLSNSWTELDATAVHPESYNTALGILRGAGLTLQDIGSAKCKEAFEIMQKTKMAEDLNVHIECVNQIVQALITPLQHDFREDNSKPLFREGVLSMDEVRVGMKLTGQITNITHFGAFIDLGLGTDGLLHIKALNKGPPVTIGQPVMVKVQSLDKVRKRIGLDFA